MGRGRLKSAAVFAAGVIGGAAAVLLLRPDGRGPSTSPTSSGGAIALTEAELAMERPVPEVWFDAVPLDEAIDRLRPAAGVPIDVDWPAFAAAGISRRAPVIVRCRNVPLVVVLERVLDAASIPTARAGAAADGERIWVSTGDKLSRRVVVRVYDVRDLAPPGAVVPAHTTGGLVGPIHVPAMTLPEALVALIQETVAPDSWRAAGGAGGAISHADGRLVVAQTPESHRLVRHLLAQLREIPPPSVLPISPGQEQAVQRWDERIERWVSTDPAAADAALRRALPEVSLDVTSLEQSAARLGELFGAVITVDRKAIDAAMPGAAADPPGRILVRLRNATLAEALRAVLDAAGATPPLTWWSAGEVITLTTTEKAAEHPVTETYDVRDWLRSEGVPVPANPVEAVVLSTADTGPRAAAVERLTAAVREAVAPDSWREAGGSTGSIRELGGRLIVRQSWENQERVRRFIHTHLSAPPKPGGGSAVTQPSSQPAVRASFPLPESRGNLGRP